MNKFFISLLFFSSLIQAKELSLEQVLSSTKKHHPKILEVIQKVSELEGEVKSNEGQFDSSIKFDSQERMEGFYDGDVIDGKIEKPFQWANSKVFLGQRQSQGKFAEYEGDFKTLENGETFVGFQLSLLKNRAIDKKRFKLIASQLKLNQSEDNLRLTEIMVINEATKAYWQWVAYGKIFKVYDELLEVAVNRDKGLRRRVKKGDLAKIYITENQQYILKRRSKREEAKNDFLKASFYLSLYRRDDNGDIKVPKIEELPKEIKVDFQEVTKKQLENDFAKIIKTSPAIHMIEMEIEKMRQSRKLGENDLLPNLDLKFQRSNHIGAIEQGIDNEEAKISVNLSIPIERRLGKGKIAKADAKIYQLTRKKQFLSEKLYVGLQNFHNSLEISKNIIKNSKEEFRLTDILVNQELKRFQSGASDFFVVNIREQNRADANITLIKARLKYLKTLSEYQASSRGGINVSLKSNY
jgi:outer membrane protein TolC